MLVLYQIFYACAGHCERGIVHKIAWRATRSCMPHPLAQCIQTLIGDTLELFMTQCGYNGAEICCAGKNRVFDASHQHWRAGGNYPVNQTIGRFLPFIADYLTGSQLHFLNLEVHFHDRAHPRRADCGHHQRRLELCTVCNIAKCSQCTPARCLCPCEPWAGVLARAAEYHVA